VNLEFPSIVDYGLERGAEVLTRAFTGYFVPIAIDAHALVQSARVDSIDLASSCIFVRDGTAVGGALIARRGWTSRLAGMAIVPEARRRGIGHAVMNHLLGEAKKRRDRKMVLEVIEQNTAALNLYGSVGFRAIRRLIGFAGSPVDIATNEVTDALIEVDLREVAQALARYGLPDLPWQLSAETIAQLMPPHVAYRLDDAWIALSDPTAPTITIRALITDNSSSEVRRGGALLRAVMAKYPERKEWRFSAVWPEQLADLISSLALPQSPLTQWQMEREIESTRCDT
jgi:ribosomal protein S18 acetylase RimI-like enzyme